MRRAAALIAMGRGPASSPERLLVREEIVPAQYEATADHERPRLIHQPPGRPAVTKAVAAHDVHDVEDLAGGASAHPGPYPTRRAPM